MSNKIDNRTIEERVQDTILFDAWQYRQMFKTNRGFGQLGGVVPCPRHIQEVSNIRISLLINNPTPIHLGLLAFRAFNGEFDCPKDRCFAYQVAQSVFPDHQGTATFVLAKCTAEGLGGVTRNLPRANWLFKHLLSKPCLPAWLLGKNRENITTSLHQIKNTAATIIQDNWILKVERKERKKEMERFFILLCNQRVKRREKLFTLGNRRFNTGIFQLILSFCVGGRFEKGLFLFDETKRSVQVERKSVTKDKKITKVKTAAAATTGTRPHQQELNETKKTETSKIEYPDSSKKVVRGKGARSRPSMGKIP
jgi:hypothetical protein